MAGAAGDRRRGLGCTGASCSTPTTPGSVLSRSATAAGTVTEKPSARRRRRRRPGRRAGPARAGDGVGDGARAQRDDVGGEGRAGGRGGRGGAGGGADPVTVSAATAAVASDCGCARVRLLGRRRGAAPLVWRHGCARVKTAEQRRQARATRLRPDPPRRSGGDQAAAARSVAQRATAGRCRGRGRPTVSRRARWGSPRPPGRRPSTGGPAARRTARCRSSPRRWSCAGRASNRTRRASRWRAPARAGRPDRGLQGVQRRGHPARHGEVVPGRPGVAGVEADADPRVVLQRREVRAEVLDGGRQRLPPPAVGSMSSRGARRAGRPAPAAAARAAGGARLVPVLADRGAGVHHHALAAEPVPRARLCAIEAIDCSTVASVGEPTLTRKGVWMNDGTPRSAQPAVKAASCCGSPAVSFQPRGLPTKTCTARGGDGVGVGESAPGQAALDLDVRADRGARVVQGHGHEASPGSSRWNPVDGLAGRRATAGAPCCRRTGGVDLEPDRLQGPVASSSFMPDEVGDGDQRYAGSTP